MRLDDDWALLFPPARRPHLGLTASWCTYGRRFAPRFFPLRLAATPCGSLQLPSSAPVGSFHPTRFCPCWAHWGPIVVTFYKRRLPHWQPPDVGAVSDETATNGHECTRIRNLFDSCAFVSIRGSLFTRSS